MLDLDAKDYHKWISPRSAPTFALLQINSSLSKGAVGFHTHFVIKAKWLERESIKTTWAADS